MSDQDEFDRLSISVSPIHVEVVEEDRAPIRVQASVGKPLRELQDTGWHWGTEGEEWPDAQS